MKGARGRSAIALAARLAAAMHDPEFDLEYEGVLANVAEYLDEAIEGSGDPDPLEVFRAALLLAVGALGALARCPGLEGVDPMGLERAGRVPRQHPANTISAAATAATSRRR